MEKYCREEMILDIPNVSFLNGDDTEGEKIASLLENSKSDFLFCCGDIFTKIWESNVEVEWGCKNSFMKISASKDGTEYYYGEANMLPNCIEYYE